MVEKEITLPAWVETMKPDYLDSPPEGSMSIKDLVKAWGVSYSTVSHRLDGLVENGEFEVFKVKTDRHVEKYYRPILS